MSKNRPEDSDGRSRPVRPDIRGRRRDLDPEDGIDELIGHELDDLSEEELDALLMQAREDERKKEDPEVENIFIRRSSWDGRDADYDAVPDEADEEDTREEDPDEEELFDVSFDDDIADIDSDEEDDFDDDPDFIPLDDIGLDDLADIDLDDIDLDDLDDDDPDMGEGPYVRDRRPYRRNEAEEMEDIEDEEDEAFYGGRLHVKRPPKALVVLLVILALAAGLVFGFRLDTVTVKGTRRVSDKQVKAIIGTEDCMDHTLLLWLKNRKIDLSQEPLINSIRVSLNGRNGVIVTVDEKLLVGYFKLDGKKIYVNDNGTVLDPASGSTDGVPEIVNIAVSLNEDGTALVCENQRAFDNAMDVACGIAQLNVKADQLILQEGSGYEMVCGKIRVELGTNTLMEQKIEEFQAILPQLKDLSGSLDLKNFDASSESVIFTKD